MTIGQRIKEKRTELGITQDQLATLCNVSRQTIYKWEGDIALPDTNSLPSLSKHLGLSYEELIEGNNDGIKQNITVHHDYSGLATSAENLVKKHWQKAGYEITIGGVIFLIFGITLKSFSKYFFPSTDSFGEPIEYEGIEKYFNGITTITIIVGALMLIGGIGLIIYDRKKINQLKEKDNG